MEGQDSLHTILVFVGPFSLIVLINLITTVIKIFRGLTTRSIITTLLLLLVNMTLPVLYVSMVMSKAPENSIMWEILILVLTILLTASVIAIFLVDMSFFDHLTTIIDQKRRASGHGSSAVCAGRRYVSGKPYEFPPSGLTLRRTQVA